MKPKKVLTWILRFTVLLILYYVFFIGGSMAVSGMLPTGIKSEPGLVSANSGFLIVGIVNTLVVMALVLSSRWTGWKLALLLSLAYYGAITFIMQIETWYFLSGLTVSPALLPRLFIMGLPVAFLYIPLAVWILGKWKTKIDPFPNTALVMPVQQWIWKLMFIAIAYVVLYWCAGYFIAWQNPVLRSFYGSRGAIVPFWKHTANTLQTDPGLFPFQVLRAMIWTLCALPVIRGSKLNAWHTALLLGIFFSIPQNIGHIMENPLMPIASVRLSHFIETASSTFVFALIIAWLLHRKHYSMKDLFGLSQQK
jgi:hypothetical protein